MFDFEKLDLYQLVKNINIEVLKHIDCHDEISEYLSERWKEVSMEVVLNLVEGTGKMSTSEKKEYLTTARGYVFECVAVLETIKGMEQITEEDFTSFYDDYEQASKMLLGMFRSYDRPR